MNASEIESAIREARRSLESRGSLEKTGFWRAVGHVRADRDLAARFAEQIGEIDTENFTSRIKLRVPAGIGVGILLSGTAAGVAFVVLADATEGLVADLSFLAGFGALLVSTHSLAHWVVGKLLGMEFTHFFLGGPPPPRPGAKVDYATYLLVAPRKRAFFHASGAVVTKLLPFALIPISEAQGRSIWVTFILAGIGVLQIVTDALFSTKTSDWKKYLREIRASHQASGWS